MFYSTNSPLSMGRTIAILQDKVYNLGKNSLHHREPGSRVRAEFCCNEISYHSYSKSELTVTVGIVSEAYLYSLKVDVFLKADKSKDLD